MKLITIITFAALALTAEAKNRRALKAGKSDKAGKSSKVDGIGHECQSCENQLPGYALFGKNYEEDDFYENLVDLIFENLGSGGLFESFDGELPEFGEDFFVPGPFGWSTGFETCYDDAASLITCGLITFIGEAIYRSELLSCLYTQTLTFARDEFAECRLDSDERKRHLLSDRQNEAVDRVLQSGITDPQQQDTMTAMAMMGAESLLDLSEVLGLECGSTENAFIEMICKGGENRKLLPDVEGIPIASTVVPFLEFVDGIDADTAMAIQDNLFFGSCNFSNTICAALFGLLKTFDAIICRFRDERGCGSESCTKDLAFDVNFQAERLIIDLPFFEEFDVSRFLAPCDYCLANKSNGCAAFCPYYESIGKCPPPFSSAAFYLSASFAEGEFL